MVRLTGVGINRARPGGSGFFVLGRGIDGNVVCCFSGLRRRFRLVLKNYGIPAWNEG